MKLRLLMAALATVLASLVGLGSATPANAAVDIYITPGTHNVNGRVWHTTCGPYSSTINRCRTDIKSGSVFVFNNLTYVAAPRAAWAGNHLAETNEWTASGRRWRTECDTAVTGYNGCRSYIMGSTGSWVFNNMVRFSTDFYLKASGTGDSVVALPAGVTSGTVTMGYQGDGYFGVWTQDSANNDVELLANTVGQYQGTAAFGVEDWDQTPRKLALQAEGSWSIVVKPLSTAPKFSGSTSASTDSVVWYTGPAATLRLNYSGNGYFGVWAYYANGDADLLANTTASYAGTRSVRKGPVLMSIQSDGPWSITRVG
jgi:hypothetical protein